MSMTLIASSLAAFAPVLLDVFDFDNDNDKKAAEAVVNIAKNVTGASTPQTALRALEKNSDSQLIFKKQIDAELSQLTALLDDRKDARKNYINSHKMADRMAERVMRYNLPLAALVLCIQCVATYFLREHAALISATTSATTLVVKHLLDERKEVTGFYFGGSLSRTKT